MTMVTTKTESSREVFNSLEGACQKTGLDALALKLVELRAWLEGDLREVEGAIALQGAGGESLAEKCARHLLDQGGKRLRPICVALAARTGDGFNDAARAYAVAVEIIHSATLLHDDVVDLGDVRRGADAARIVYGNAASIFGGDWLLVEALTRIESAGHPEVLSRMLSVIKEMVIAEAIQLERRGQVTTSTKEYFRIVEGKTASLFRWAMFAGATAGGVSREVADALEAYGEKLGVAFQIVDDVLDVAGDGAETGKALLADAREGKMTYPLILAIERDPRVAEILGGIIERGDAPVDVAATVALGAALERARAVESSLEYATKLCREAMTRLEVVPAGRARSALESVAIATPRRRR